MILQAWKSLADGACALSLLLVVAGCESRTAAGAAVDTCGDCADVAADAAEDTTSHDVPAAVPDVVSVPPVGGDRIGNIKASSNFEVALSASLTFTSDKPAYGAMLVETDGTQPFLVEADQTAPVTSHEVWVVGLKPATSYRLRARVRAPGTDEVFDADAVTLVTASLPAILPTIQVPVWDASRAAPGVTMFVLTIESTSGAGAGPSDPRQGIYAVDASGRIVSIVRPSKFPGEEIMGFNILDDGHLVLTGYFGLAEMDLYGRMVQQRSIADLGLDVLHHDLVRSPDGGWFGLATELRQLKTTKGQAVNIVVDVGVEIDASGAVIRKWYPEDFVPIPVDAKRGQGFWNKLYPNAVPNYQAYLGNSITYDPSDDTVIISLFEQGLLLKIRRTTGELVWKAGLAGTVGMAEGGSWFWRSHGPTVLPGGGLLIFDNGAGTSARGVEYALSLKPDGLYEATQTWQYVQDFFSPFGGNVDRMANGNTFLCNASRLVSEPVNGTSPSVVEVTAGPSPEIVYEMSVAPMGEAIPGPQFFMYRAKKVYDRHYWVETPP